MEEVSENSEKREELESDPFRGGKSCVATGERPEGPGISAASPATWTTREGRPSAPQPAEPGRSSRARRCGPRAGGPGRASPPSEDPAAAPSDARGGAAAGAGGAGGAGVGLALAQGPRGEMEDEALVIPELRCGFTYAAIFDGHAGRECARYLRGNLHDQLAREVDLHSLRPAGGAAEEAEFECAVGPDGVSPAGGLCCPIDLTASFQGAFAKADATVLRHLEGLGADAGGDSGSTASVVLVRADRVIAANVGDSRAVLCRGGAPLELTTEHRVYGRSPSCASEKARVEGGGGWVTDGRVCSILAVSRAFGDRDFKSPRLPHLLEMGVQEGVWTRQHAEGVHFTADPVTAAPDITEIQLGPEDEFLVLASDGVWDTMTSRQALQIVRKELQRGATVQEAATLLTERAIRRYTQDNVAVVVVPLALGGAGPAGPGARAGGSAAAGEGGAGHHGGRPGGRARPMRGDAVARPWWKFPRKDAAAGGGGPH